MRGTRVVSLLAVGLVGLLSLLSLPRAALAGPLELAGEHFSFPFAFDCEGLWVEGVLEGVHTHPIRTDQAGNVIFTDTYAGRQTHVGYQNADGTWTFVDTYTGIPTSLGGTGNGAVKDRGRVVFTAVVDLNDPDDPFDDELVSLQVNISGPHPQLEPGFNGCDVLKAAIG